MKTRHNVLVFKQILKLRFRKQIHLAENSLNHYSYGFFWGRIAQLVELLSYTQVVIGSSPFAPKLSILRE